MTLRSAKLIVMPESTVLADFFALTPSEAKLALAVCRGMTIAEAAVEHGIAEGTARTYSKSIYSKMGARGLPDLVRIVMRSVLAMTSEPSLEYRAY